MPRQIAFLRAINVGGRNVKMEHLRNLFAGLGFGDIETFIASGNVGFTTRARGGAPLEQKIEKMLQCELGYEVTTFVRTPAELAAVVAHKAFPAAKVAAAGALSIGLLKAPLAAAGLEKLAALRTDIDDFHAHGRELWWLCREKQSSSTFSNAVFERALRAKATFRGIKTLEKIAAHYAAAAP